MQNSYYDIDAILSEEEVISVTNYFDFSHLAHLDPDYIPSRNSVSVDDDISIDVSNLNNKKIKKSKVDQKLSCSHTLYKGTTFKMPLWSIEDWVHSGFVVLTLPRHFSRKTRERIEADPVSIDLRNKNERFFMTGIKIVSLLKKSHSNLTQPPNTNPFERELTDLKLTLLQTYSGIRLRRTFDWTLSPIEDDLSLYTLRLTHMELVLFDLGAASSKAHAMWKLFGSRRINVIQKALKSSEIEVGTD